MIMDLPSLYLTCLCVFFCLCLSDFEHDHLTCFGKWDVTFVTRFNCLCELTMSLLLLSSKRKGFSGYGFSFILSPGAKRLMGPSQIQLSSVMTSKAEVSLSPNYKVNEQEISSFLCKLLIH